MPHLFKPLDKAAPKALGEEKGRAAISAGSDELELTGTVNTVVERHGAEEYTRDGAAGQKRASLRETDPKKRDAPAGDHCLGFAL
jgi:hypothetical protein